MTPKEEIEKYLTLLNHCGSHPYVTTVPFVRRFFLEERSLIDRVEISILYEQCLDRYYHQHDTSKWKKHVIFVKSAPESIGINSLYSDLLVDFTRFTLFGMTTLGRLKDGFGNSLNIYSIQDLLQYGLNNEHSKHYYNKKTIPVNLKRRPRIVEKAKRLTEKSYGNGH